MIDFRIHHDVSMKSVQNSIGSNTVNRATNLRATLTSVAALATQLFVLIIKHTMVGSVKGILRTVCFQSGTPYWDAWRVSASKTAAYAEGVFLSFGSVLSPKRLTTVNAEAQYQNGLFQNQRDERFSHSLQQVQSVKIPGIEFKEYLDTVPRIKRLRQYYYTIHLRCMLEAAKFINYIEKFNNAIKAQNNLHISELKQILTQQEAFLKEMRTNLKNIQLKLNNPYLKENFSNELPSIASLIKNIDRQIAFIDLTTQDEIKAGNSFVMEMKVWINTITNQRLQSQLRDLKNQLTSPPLDGYRNKKNWDALLHLLYTAFEVEMIISACEYLEPSQNAIIPQDLRHLLIQSYLSGLSADTLPDERLLNDLVEEGKKWKLSS